MNRTTKLKKKSSLDLHHRTNSIEAAQREMNRTPNLKKKSAPAPTAKLDSTRKKAPSHRNPLKDLNSTITTTRSDTRTCYASSSSSNSNSSSSSSLSIETPRGCLKFFLPNSSSKNPPKSYNKTPKSAPISKPRSKPPISQKIQTTPFFNKSEYAKDYNFRELQHTPHPKSSPDLKKFGSGPLQWPFARISADDDGKNFTPVVNKLGCGSDLDGYEDVEENSNTPTPPVQASISPEIQCSSSFTSSKSACYGAGHVLSGVTDKRKCRPRGILVVEQEKDFGFFKDGLSVDDGSFQGFFNNSRVSLITAPSEASMHWLSPPREEGHGQKESPPNESTPFPYFSSSSSYGLGFSSDICGNTNSTTNTTSSTRKNASVVTPSEHLDFKCLLRSEIVMPNEERGYRCESLGRKISPSSGGDSLGSYNVVSTPQSDSSLDELSWFKNAKGCMFEFDSMSNIYSTPSLSPSNRTSMRDPADVLPLPGFSFQFTHPTSPSSSFIDQAQLQKTYSYGNSWQSQKRISWRDGLASRIFEMDDLDCCRLLSDEEEDVNCKVDEDVVRDTLLTGDVRPNEVMSKQPQTDKRCNTSVLEKPSSCAESMSTEGAELITSSDSDWNLCYKNSLFEE